MGFLIAPELSRHANPAGTWGAQQHCHTHTALPWGSTSLTALQAKSELVEATKVSKNRLGLFIAFSCSCILLLLSSRGVERLEPGLRCAENITGNRQVLQQGMWQLDTGEMALREPGQTPEQGKQ